MATTTNNANVAYVGTKVSRAMKKISEALPHHLQVAWAKSHTHNGLMAHLC